jgi:sulfur-oxidizing protein SoxA
VKRLHCRAAVLAATLAAATVAPAQVPRRSGAEFMSEALRAMQDDPAQNPGLLWVKQGEQLWTLREPPRQRSCADCHGPAEAPPLKDVAARYPAWDATLARPVTLAQRVELCRQRHQGLAPRSVEHDDALALQAWLGWQARGLPLAPPADERLAPHVQAGERLFHLRQGQLDLACAHCHAQRAGLSLGGSPIPQGHATGYPSYRLQWQGLGTLQRRLRSCLAGVRAEPFAADAPEWVQLELYLARRAAGMAVETPAVRP